MPTIKLTFTTPTDNVTASANLDILLYNGLLGSEVLFETILKGDIRKTIVGANMEITGISVSAATTYNFSAKARDEAGNLSAAFSPVNNHVVPAAAYVMVTDLNATLSASITYTAGTPNILDSSATNQLLKYNTQKSGAFSMKMFIKDVYTKSIGFGIDDVNNNTDLPTIWSAFIFVTESYGVFRDVPGTLSINTPTTVTATTGNYLRMSRANDVSPILLHYFNGTSEALIHTFSAASSATWLKATLSSASRRIYDLQIQ